MSATQHRRTAVGFEGTAARLAEIGRDFHRRGWVLGTSGNFSAVLSENPLEIAITASGANKGALAPENLLVVNGEGDVLRGAGRSSAETLLHLSLVRLRGAGAILHTHSVWSTVLSDLCAADRGLSIQGYEMLKGLNGVTTHEHREWLPILENSQDMAKLALSVSQTLAEHAECHGFLLLRHGLYTWGKDLQEATRHVEILEFLLEAIGRQRSLSVAK